jgi:4-amino-4-deoxy-L-arabinose transferase-like glycosyltransferase
LFSFLTAVIAGVLTAFAPQFSYHSALMLPDELSAIPILLAVYCLTLIVQRRQVKFALLCGVSIGISCWFRSNALVLPLYFAAVAAFLLPRKLRIRAGAILLVAFILTIVPITIRNYAVFERFIPLSLGLGTTFLEGLSDYDTDGVLGMPRTDEDVMEMDVRLAGRVDYRGNLLNPDGVDRERRRITIGVAVAGDNPLWFARSVAHRGLTTLRMERVPAIAAERDERETTPPAFYLINRPLKAIQRLFVTAVILPLALLAVISLLRRRDARQSLAILSIVPLYYMTMQALIHTEYRYVLATTHILIILAAVTLGFAINAILKRARISLHSC